MVLQGDNGVKNSIDTSREIKVLIAQLRAFRDTVNSILTNENAAESARYVSFADLAMTYNDFVAQVNRILKVSSVIYTFNMSGIKGWADTLWPQQKRIVEQVLLYTKLLIASLEGSLEYADDEFDNLEYFIQSKLRTVIFQKPEKEIEIQNGIESLLLGRGLAKGLDYDRESGKFEFSGKEYIPDFIIPKFGLCIEVKLLREGRKSKMIEEISADITAYKKIYQRQLFVIYDLGVIQNEVEFKRDIEMIDGVKVIIVKH